MNLAPVFPSQAVSVPELGFLEDEIISGLTQSPKEISPRFFYDISGSRLFELICELDEYYLTRCESEILATHRLEIMSLCRKDSVLLELGSGNCRKIRLLLNDNHDLITYVPVDISHEHLLEACRRLHADYPLLTIHPVASDFTDLSRIPLLRTSHGMAFFFGSSLGNLEPEKALGFLRKIARILGPKNYFIVGVDLKKDPALLEKAYNDAQGVTAAFNLNLLHRINRELGGTFNVGHFQHRAFYNPEKGRIEMHLISLKAQEVRVAGTLIRFEAGESLHTENSYKYEVEEFRQLARLGGFKPSSLTRMGR